MTDKQTWQITDSLIGDPIISRNPRHGQKDDLARVYRKDFEVARLMVAAPALRDALVRIRDNLRTAHPFASYALRQAEAALAQAEGER